MENQRLITNVHEQLDRLTRQLRDIEREKDAMDEEDYREMKADTIDQLNDLSLTLERMQSGDMSVFDELSTTRLVCLLIFPSSPQFLGYPSSRQPSVQNS
uniref:HAP1 N-terminal domain-containing protein n=1 Tax=Steinernema glaseri TaxID=37863 RepID=A0A1I7YH29_9BILA